MVQGFLGVDQVRVAQDPIGPANLVGDHVGVVFEQFFARILLVGRHLRDHAFKAADDGFLGLTKCRLIGNLIKVAERFGAFAIDSAHSETDFIDRLQHLTDLIAEHERGQMQHRRCTQSRAEVGRTRGEVTKLRIEGKFQ